MSETLEEYKYLTYSSLVPMGETCIRVGAEKIPENVLQRTKTSLWDWPSFRYVVYPGEYTIGPHGNIYWLYNVVWVKRPFDVVVWEYGNGRRTEKSIPATVELKEEQDLFELCKEIENRWK
jgi:hypothetical protein